MANHPSASKRARQNKKRALINKSYTSATRKVIKKIRSFVADKNREEAYKYFPFLQSLLAKLVKKGIIKKSNASRRISRLAKHIAGLKENPSTDA